MFFLLRTAFWLSLVILLIPADPSTGSESDEPAISTLQALGAAQQTYTDMTRFCERNTVACQTGGAALEIFGAKARAGARMIYQYLEPTEATPETTAGIVPGHPAAGSVRPEALPVGPDAGTLTARDRAPAWVAPVPLDKPA